MGGVRAETSSTEPTVENTNTAGSTSTFTDELEQILNAQSTQQEQHQFQAEINQLLGILINSLYSNKDIFLRELISNASDALNKIRFLSLTDSSALNAYPELEIRVWADTTNNILKIRDSGIGMTKQDLINNLGTIAKSGTKAFIEKIQKEAQTSDSALIGQFGVGFYSVFLVASKVVVTTKNNDDKQLIWTSTADNTFTIIEDPRGDTLKRGSEITIYLKDDAKDYTSATKLKELIKKYSSFIHFPIYLHEVRTETEEVPIEEEETTTTTETTTEETTTPETTEEVKVEEEKKTEETPAAPKTKKVEKTVEEWNIMNENKPLWLRSPSNITEEEYIQFYRAMTAATEDPMMWDLFSAEGQVEFKSLLYVPAKAPYNMFDFTQKTNNIKLYVKRVFITDQGEDLLPRYLNFIKGLVDSEDLPLNVSRETLQHSKLLAMIKKKLLAKAIQILHELSEQDKAERKEREEKKEESKEGEEKKEEVKLTKYEKFWKEFGKNIKLGVIEDEKQRKKLVSMLRFTTSKTNESISLDEYVARKKEKQEQIYFISGMDMKEVESSPHMEEFKTRDLEVIYMIDPLDEYMTQQVTEYQGMKIQSIAKEDVKFPDEDLEKKKKDLESLTKEFETLTSIAQMLLKEKVSKVTISNRLSSAPAVLVSSSFGVSANMARIMKAQALGQEQGGMDWMMKLRTLELNANHPIIQNMNDLLKNNVNDDSLTNSINLVYDTASLLSGYDIEEKNKFATRIIASVNSQLAYKNNLAKENKKVEEVKTEEVKPEPVEKDEL